MQNGTSGVIAAASSEESLSYAKTRKHRDTSTAQSWSIRPCHLDQVPQIGNPNTEVSRHYSSLFNSICKSLAKSAVWLPNRSTALTSHNWRALSLEQPH